MRNVWTKTRHAFASEIWENKFTKKSFDRAIEGRLFNFLDLKLHRDQFQDVFGCIG